MADDEELAERVAELERRVAALEAGAAAPGAAAGAVADGGDFWALTGLKARLAESGAGGDGAVLFTGAVRPGGGDETYEWQYGMPVRALLAADWAEAAESFAALGHPVRMRLLREIVGGRRAVAELATLDGLGTTGQIYHHLRQLTSAGWLQAQGRGRYQVPPARMVPLLVALAASRP